ncbi:MAG TPA: futalosine hydrolase [Jatrophihabitantaceae bacterium]|nr:futalosine hydrolase [Jatrophihabitantaceae bacterium]
MARLLVVTAVEAERAAVAEALPPDSSGVTLLAGGVGPAAAAAAASAALASGDFDLVLAAGIGGGFAPLVPGEIAVASSVVFADLGAETADGFVPLSELGFGGERYDVDPQLAIELADVTGGRLGTVLTVATVTGTAATTARLVARYPDAVAEAMEGAGVAAAAVRHGVRFAELRAISNAVGPRDRDAWRIPDALAALGRAVAAVCTHAQGWTS